MSYNKKIWANGDLIKEEHLNNIENGIYTAHDEINTLKNNTSTGGGTGGGVDLSGYVTKETGNANQITFADGQTFQAKLNNGTLKGEKGDKGERGEQGLQGAKGEKGDKGDQGLQGLKGDKGDKGDAFNYEDFTQEQLATLKGEKGDTREQGIQGERGLPGERGEQ